MLTFLIAAALLTVTPGVDTALVLRTAAVEGPRSAAYAGLGVVLGCLGWGAAAAVGLGGLVAASDAGYTLLKWLGAAYLLWLGAKLILQPRAALVVTEVALPDTRGAAWLTRGMLTNLLNPKVGVFYVSFFPQFVPDGAAVGSYSFMLAAIHAAMNLVWFALLVAASVPIARVLRRPGFVTMLDRATGCVFVAFGAKLALSRR
jgi:threonine/homoserine/homoserine lactone efflux protein